jgi:hypothetical protein
MKIKRLVVGALLSSTAICPAFAADIKVLPTKAQPLEVPFFIVNDTSFSYYHALTATDPGVNKTQKDVLEITHF